MRCSCSLCDSYMVQSEKGLNSGCVCPECLNVCRACMGGGDAPIDVEMIKQIYSQGNPNITSAKVGWGGQNEK